MEEYISKVKAPIKVAVLGCAVNGPGEAREADIGIAGARGEGLLFRKGQIVRKVPEETMVEELKKKSTSWQKNTTQSLKRKKQKQNKKHKKLDGYSAKLFCVVLKKRCNEDAEDKGNNTDSHRPSA